MERHTLDKYQIELLCLSLTLPHLRSDVEDAKLVLGHDAPDGLEGGAEEIVVVLADVEELVVLQSLEHALVAHEPARLPVDLVGAHRPVRH